MSDYRLDKSAFRIMTFKQADNASVFDQNIVYSERLRQAYFLILQAYGFSLTAQPRLDKSIFSSRKQNK